MPLLKIEAADGLAGPTTGITLRTEQVEAVWRQESPTAGFELINLLFKSGETVRLDVSDRDFGTLWLKIQGAL